MASSSGKYKGGKVKKRSYADEVRLASHRAAKRAAGMYDDSDDDTDSVASSASSLAAGPGGRKIGISPLNRRRSLRLALKNQMDTDPTQVQPVQQVPLLKGQSTRVLRGRLLGQKTVEMKSPPVHLERMETSTRWSKWRNKPAVVLSQDTIGTKKRVVHKMDTTPGPGPRISRQATKRRMGALGMISKSFRLSIDNIIRLIVK